MFIYFMSFRKRFTQGINSLTFRRENTQHREPLFRTFSAIKSSYLVNALPMFTLFIGALSVVSRSCFFGCTGQKRILSLSAGIAVLSSLSDLHKKHWLCYLRRLLPMSTNKFPPFSETPRIASTWRHAVRSSNVLNVNRFKKVIIIILGLYLVH